MASVSFQSLSTLHLVRMQIAQSKIGLPVRAGQLASTAFRNIHPIPIRGEQVGYSPYQLNRIDKHFVGATDGGFAAIGTQVNLLA